MKDISSHLRSITATTTSKMIQMQIEMCDLVLSGFDFFPLLLWNSHPPLPAGINDGWDCYVQCSYTSPEYWILLQGYNSNSLFLSFNETGLNFKLILWVMYKMQVWMKSLRGTMVNHDPYLLVSSILRSSFSFLFPNFIFPYGSTINCCWLVNAPTTFVEHKSHLEIPKCIPPVKDSEHQVHTDGSFLLP